MSFDLAGVARSVVAATIPLDEVLDQDAPVARTRTGDEHAFDRAVARALAARRSPLARRRLRVPVTFWVDKDASNDAYVQDATAADALRAIGVVPVDRDARREALARTQPRPPGGAGLPNALPIRASLTSGAGFPGGYGGRVV